MKVVVHVDGGARGNPGPAAAAAVVSTPDGDLLDEASTTLGTATNNVAEYHGLLAGLRLHAEHTPDADLEVRMDSKLVVEQMSGNWRIKHPDLQPLAQQAAELAPPG